MNIKAKILDLIKGAGPIKRNSLLHIANDWAHYSNDKCISDRKMRLLVAELIADGEPIASSERGYSIIQNVDQLRSAVNYLKAKAKTISIRGNTLIGNYDRRYQDCPANIQFKLF